MATTKEEFEAKLSEAGRLHVQQVYEAFEIVLGWESRNKYRILDQDQNPIGYAAEKSQSLSGTILRQVFGHWRKFDIVIFNQAREPMYNLHFAFRWFFKSVHVTEVGGGPIGTLQQRFALFRKKYDVMDVRKRVLARINSPFFKFWTFEFTFRGKRLGTVSKKWSGLLAEAFTDKDNFIVTFADRDLTVQTRILMLAQCFLIDIIHFEGKADLLDLVD